MLAVVGEAGAAAAARAGTRKQTAAGAPSPSEPQPEPAGTRAGAVGPSSRRPAAKARIRSPRTTEPAPSKPAATPVASDSDAGYVTPLVRKLAKEHSVDLSAVTGTGVGGRVRKQDVLPPPRRPRRRRRRPEGRVAAPAPAQAPAAAASAPAASAAPSSLRGTTEKMSRLRKTIAKRMVESLQVSAQLTATVEVDLTEISRIRADAKDDFKKREGASLSYLPFITKAAIEALKVYPKVNATIDTEAGKITYPDAEHVGIAVDTEKGLLVPVIKDAGDLNIAGLAKKIADLAARTRANKVDAGRAQRRHVHDHQLRLRGHADGHADHQPAAGRHPRHRRAGQAAGGDQGRQAR